MSKSVVPVERSIQASRQHPESGQDTEESHQQKFPLPIKPTTRPLRNLRISSGSSSSAIKTSPVKTLCLLLLAGFCFSLCLQFSHLRFWWGSAGGIALHAPTMTTLDAYHYLTITRQLLNRQNVSSAGSSEGGRHLQEIPLLATITAAIHKWTDLSIEQVAFYLPPVLGSLMVIVYTCWGYTISGPVTALLSSLAGVSSFYWYSRTCLGRFDTDSLNPFFVFLILFCVYRFAVDKGRTRILYLLSALMTAHMFHLWWLQVPYFGFFLAILAYCLSVFLPSSKVERAIKMALIFLVGSAVFYALSGFSESLPHQLKGFINGYAGQLRLIGNKAALISTFPNIGLSISELQPLPLPLIIEQTGGHAVPFAIALIGLFFLGGKNKEAAAFLGIGLIVALLSVLARRFLIFFIPLYALGMGYFVGEICFRSTLLAKIPSNFLKWGLLLLVSVALLLPSVSMSFSRHRGPTLTKHDMALAQVIKERAAPRDLIWTWWDYGYFLHYHTGLKTFVDGGSQTGERSYIAAFPLSCGNPLLARNWIRFFAAHDLQGLREVESFVGSRKKALAFLQNILARPDNAETFLKQYGIQNVQGWKEFFFPSVKVWLFLNEDFINKTYWWYYFGTWDPMQGSGAHPLFRLLGGQSTQQIRTTCTTGNSEGALKVDAILYVSVAEGTPGNQASLVACGEEKRRLPFQHTGHESVKGIDLVAVVLQGSDVVYVVESAVLQSLAARLVFGSPWDTAGFQSIGYAAPLSGVWRVE